MLITVFGTLIFMKKSTESFPERITNFWNGWEVRGLVLLSLLLQIVLILLGKRRKYIPKNWIKIILWGAYLSADWIATLSLGVLSRKELVPPKNEIAGKNHSFDHNYVLMAFWAPFLLVHLGGPDTITSYSLEDNELWPRRLLELVVQFGVAIYVLIRSWVGAPVNFLAIPMFIAGIIKFGERIWVLRSASSDFFRDSLLPLPDPGPNYAKFMDGYSSKKAEGFKISVGTINDTTTVVRRNNSPSSDALHDAYYFFKTFERLFADLILSFQDRENSRSFFQQAGMNFEKAFEVIEIELGFMYDLLHTKASLIHSRWGSFFRFVSLLCTFSAFLGFLIIDKNAYSTIDKSITLFLLVGAIVLEIYAVIVLLPSDWTTLWLSKHENKLVDLISKANSCFQSCFGLCFLLPLNKRWSNSVAQYNLMSHCIKRKSFKGSRTKNFIKYFSKDFIKDFIHKMLEKYWYRNLKPVSKDLKEKIFVQLKNAKSISDIRDSYMQLFACTGDDHDEEKKRICNLDETILRLHIATDLCYNIDQANHSETVKNLICLSQSLSNYLVYLLVMCPYMLPSGIGQIKFQDTCAEAIEFIKEREYISDEHKACDVLFKVNTEILPSRIKGDRSKSVLFDACKLAQSLQCQEEPEEKWRKISEAWVGMLSDAASQCRWNYHARRLRQGGELLTHVWLLMSHLGITEHFQIARGHLRAKLFLR